MQHPGLALESSARLQQWVFSLFMSGHSQIHWQSEQFLCSAHMLAFRPLKPLLYNLNSNCLENSQATEMLFPRFLSIPLSSRLPRLSI